MATGIIAADVFATIAATSNGLLIAMAQALKHDILPRVVGRRDVPLALLTVVVGAFTMGLSTVLHGSVAALALGAVSFMGAGLAPAVMVKVMRWKHDALSLLCAMVGGFAAAVVWKQLGYGGVFNEAGIGIAVGLAMNALVARR